MVNDNEVSDTPATVGTGTTGSFSRTALLLAFAGGAFASWIIMQLAY